MPRTRIRYMCFPSVVCVGKETEVWIKPRDISRIFRPEWQYSLAVVGLREDQLSYYDPIPKDHPFEIREGCLVFRHVFDGEQEYSIRFCRDGEKEERVRLYAVKEDLYALRPLKGDLHSHSYYSDGRDGTFLVPANYREAGFDFFALTDHNRMYTSRYAADFYKDVKLGLHILPGEEVHTPVSMAHIVHAGGRESVCEQYMLHREDYEAAVDAIEKTLSDVNSVYRRRLAMAKWAVDAIHRTGGIAIFAHPFWCPNRYNLSEEFLELIYESVPFDAFELMGGVTDPADDCQLAFWQEQNLRGNYRPPVGSSDSHNHVEEECFNRRFTLAFARENTTEAILDAVRQGNTVAAEVPEGSTPRLFGSLRLVMFSHFLLDTYFAETRQLCFGEGILMRRYAEGEDVGDILSALGDSVENFYKRFYGILPAEGIPQSRKEMLDRLLQTQREKGTHSPGARLVAPAPQRE